MSNKILKARTEIAANAIMMTSNLQNAIIADTLDTLPSYISTLGIYNISYYTMVCVVTIYTGGDLRNDIYNSQ